MLATLYWYSPQRLPIALTILADRWSLEQVFINVTMNARDAMPDGGKLRLRTTAAEVDIQRAGLNPEARPDNRLVNTVMQQRARWLLSRKSELFLVE